MIYLIKNNRHAGGKNWAKGFPNARGNWSSFQLAIIQHQYETSFTWILPPAQRYSN